MTNKETQAIMEFWLKEYRREHYTCKDFNLVSYTMLTLFRKPVKMVKTEGVETFLVQLMKSVLEAREQAKEEWAKLKPIEEASSVQERISIGEQREELIYPRRERKQVYQWCFKDINPEVIKKIEALATKPLTEIESTREELLRQKEVAENTKAFCDLQTFRSVIDKKIKEIDSKLKEPS